jgi:dihydroxy-acid dehydratase
LEGNSLRSARWFAGDDLAGFLHRTSVKVDGVSSASMRGRPVVGICNSWSELVSCNLHFRSLAKAVRRGILDAGGLPLEFPTISLGENLMKPTTMLFRNLMSMDVEECIRAYPLDAVVLLGGCDKTVPAQLMGAASAGIPAIMTTGGPAPVARFRGSSVSAGTDLWHYVEDVRAGRMTHDEFDELESVATRPCGHCNEMGTASSMTCVVEALGMCLPGTATIPALATERGRAAEETGRRAVELALEGQRPAEILTAEAFDNAITLLAAIGGSTNVVIHLLALAGRVGVPLSLERFDELSSRTPLLVNVLPSGEHLVEDLHEAGGVPAVLRELEPLLHADAPTVSGRTLREGLAQTEAPRRDVVAALAEPLASEGGIAVLRGSLAPDGAIIKRTAASPELLRHRGPAVVFEDVYDVQDRIDDPALDVTPESVLVLRNSGPKGGPGMPEWGQVPIPQKLLRAGVTDMVRVSDARMSGTAFGTVVLHVAPESAVGGPLALVENGDPIVLDTEERRIELDLPTTELHRRADRLELAEPRYKRGYGALFLEHVLQANEGCDFDFLRALSDADPETDPLGLLSGWVGGW